MDRAPRAIEGILTVIDEGSKTGTHKYGLLLAILDHLERHPRTDGRITRADIVESYLRVHWHQVEFFRGGDHLRQNPGDREHKAVTVVRELRALGIRSPEDAVSDARARRPCEDLGKDIWRNPVLRLQIVAGEQVPFLYPFTPSDLTLNPGVRDDLLNFTPLLRPMLEAEFTRKVARINRGRPGVAEEVFLQDHLFGSTRDMPPQTIRGLLRDIQAGACFYSGVPLAGAHVDHVIPWARVRLSTIENFALSTSAANLSKTSLMLGADQIDRWRRHLDDHAGSLAEIHERFGWHSDMELTMEVAGGVYERLPDGAVLWEGIGHTTRMNDDVRTRILRRLAGG